VWPCIHPPVHPSIVDTIECECEREPLECLAVWNAGRVLAPPMCVHGSMLNVAWTATAHRHRQRQVGNAVVRRLTRQGQCLAERCTLHAARCPLPAHLRPRPCNTYVLCWPPAGPMLGREVLVLVCNLYASPSPQTLHSTARVAPRHLLS
jgi:hypothetical protein